MNEQPSEKEPVQKDTKEKNQIVSESEVAKEVVLVPEELNVEQEIEKFEEEEKIKKKFKKYKYIKIDEISKLQNEYFSQLKKKTLSSIEEENKSIGVYNWQPEKSTMTISDQTQEHQNALINLNQNQKLLNIQAQPLLNQICLELCFKLKRGDQVEVKTVGEDKKLLRRLIFNIFNVGFALKIKILVPINEKQIRLWKELQIPLNGRENEECNMLIRENMDGRIILKINSIQLTLELKVPQVKLFYFMFEHMKIQKLAMVQVPIGSTNKEIEKCCEIF